MTTNGLNPDEQRWLDGQVRARQQYCQLVGAWPGYRVDGLRVFHPNEAVAGATTPAKTFDVSSEIRRFDRERTAEAARVELARILAAQRLQRAWLSEWARMEATYFRASQSL